MRALPSGSSTKTLLALSTAIPLIGLAPPDENELLKIRPKAWLAEGRQKLVANIVDAPISQRANLLDGEKVVLILVDICFFVR